MNIYKQQAEEDMNTIKGKIQYCRDVLKIGGLEPWEAKEYSDLELNLVADLKEKQRHFSRFFN